MTTITRRSPGTHDAATATFSTASVTTIEGNAIQVRGDPYRYNILNLRLDAAITLLFTSNTYPLGTYTADMIRPGDTCEWNGETYTVRDVEFVAPDGYAIVSRLTVTR